MLTGKTNEERIWNYLTAAGLNACGAAGLMGNLYAESGLIPTNLQNSYEKKLGYTDATYTAAVDSGAYTNFAKDSAGYGLAQWTYHTRKAALLAYAKAAGKSVGDLETQLAFLVHELGSSFPAVLSTLKTAKTIEAASNAVLLKFERPANQGDAVKLKRVQYGQVYYDKFAAGQAAEGGQAMAGKITTGKELAAAALNVANSYKTLYVMGCFGAPMTAANKARYCKNNPYNTAADRTAMIKAASADTFGFDCVCLIKGLLWGWSGDGSKTYGGAKYAVNGVPDIGADTMVTKCSGVSTDFSKVEVGEAVWCKGHIGIYIGGGLAVECTPKWKNCVQVTACNCTKSGYNRRNWTKHGKLPYVTYTGESENAAAGGKPADSPAMAAVDKLAKLGVINSPDYWKQAVKSGAVKYLDTLLVKAAEKITKTGPRSSTPENGIGSLVSAGVIDTPEYWVEHYRDYPSLGALLCALGGAVK